jgi:hypothetical protein
MNILWNTGSLLQRFSNGNPFDPGDIRQGGIYRTGINPNLASLNQLIGYRSLSLLTECSHGSISSGTSYKITSTKGAATLDREACSRRFSPA